MLLAIKICLHTNTYSHNTIIKKISILLSKYKIYIEKLKIIYMLNKNIFAIKHFDLQQKLLYIQIHWENITLSLLWIVIIDKTDKISVTLNRTEIQTCYRLTPKKAELFLSFLEHATNSSLLLLHPYAIQTNFKITEIQQVILKMLCSRLQA